jgi:branched-chain amino acid transport system substrate-binding protein
MKKLALFLVVMAFITVIGLQNSFAQATKEPYKIGCLVPLTGIASWSGLISQRGAQVQTDLINAAGGVNGHPIEVIYYDTQSKPEESSRAAYRLIANDKVVAITGGDSVPVAAPIHALANQNKIPTIYGGGYPVNPEKEPYSFNFSHPTDFAIARPFAYFKKRGFTKIAFLSPIGSLGDLAINLGKKYAPEYGLTIVGEEKFDASSSDVTAQLAKLRTLKPDAYVAFATGEPAAMVARNAAQINIKEPILVSHGNATPGFLKMIGNLSSVVIVPSGKMTVYEQLPDSDPAKKLMAAFDKRMKERFNEAGTYYAGQNADGIGIIVEAIKKAGGTDPVKMRDAMEATKGYVGYNGVFNMSPKDHYGLHLYDMVNITAKGGKWVLLD